MATHARQQYFADENSLSKERREFSIADEIQEKIDSVEEGAQVNRIETVKVNGTALVPDANKAVNVEVPDVIDNLYTVAADDALSAKQGKILYDYIQNIASRGRFLSNWNSATGLPTTNPSESPYPYKSGDYFIVSNVASGGGTNYRPDGSSYIIGQASTVVETEDVSVSDFYFYDGTNWLLLVNTARQIAVDSSLSTTSTNPVENRVITNALNNKQDVLTAGNHIDITNNVISAEGFQEELIAGDNITIGDKCTTESDMKGPCPSGFHIPLKTELDGLKTIMDGLSLTTTSQRLDSLKIPLAGNRYYSGKILNINYCARFWSSTKSNNGYQAYRLNFYKAGSYEELDVSSAATSYGYSLRPFKDEYITPTASWVVVEGTLGGAGIFRDQANGLISITSNGSIGYTIADKNLGATTVYNSGDILSEANCGKYYQWGNNYGFNGIGGPNPQTSSTPVDTSGYGPGNYYSSSAFIANGDNDWSSVDNKDLRGGVSQGTHQKCIHNVISAIDTTYTAGTGISIDANNEISNTLPGPTIAATAPTGTEGALWYDTTNDVLMAHDGTAWKEAGTQMKVLSYGHSTWQEFLDAYNENAVVYCRASSNSNPATGNQTRMAFMAYVNSATPTEVEFQYYRSRSDHNTQANQLDQVFVYTLTNASGGTWSVTERNTGAKAVAGTGISLGWGSGNMTISADTTVLATKTYVDEHDTVVSATAPSSPTEGMVWYDTTNDQLKVYDGTNWNVTGKEYNAGKGISIGTVQDYSAMQGPAPDGFHVPLNTEWQAVKDTRTALGGGSSDGTNFGIALKLPFAGFRNYSSADVDNQGSYGYYWSSMRNNTNNAYRLYFGSTALNPQSSDRRAYGFPVRCFKNSPIIPTSSWTKLYGTSIETGGIFWSSADGLISLSSNGQTWITIADKNLGATTVWNSGDTLSETNCGKYYQWGNNYGFARTGTIANQSTTQVDASNYGPGNYYSSDTFIKYNGRWDTTDNGNLRGGVTGVVTIYDAITNTGVLSVNGQTGNVTISEGDVLVSDQANNIFTPGMKIWGGTESDYQSLTPDSNTAYLLLAGGPTPGGWQPGVNTIGYYTMDNDILNHATTGSTFPDGVLNTAAFSTTRVHGNNTYSLYCDGSTYAYLPTGSLAEFGTNDFTLSFWVYSETNSGNMTGIVCCYAAPSDHYYGWRIADRFGGNNNLNFCRRPSSYVDNVSGISIYNDGWHNIVFTRNSGVFKVYLDTNLVITDSGNTGVQIGRNADITLGMNPADTDYSKVYLNDVIFENRGWSAQDVSDYYTLTA